MYHIQYIYIHNIIHSTLVYVFRHRDKTRIKSVENAFKYSLEFLMFLPRGSWLGLTVV